MCDFGLARRACLRSFGRTKIETQLTPNVVSLWYRPPELLLGGTWYGESIDNWGAGCIFAELFGGHPLFRSKTELHAWELIKGFKGGVKKGEWEKGSELPKVAVENSRFKFFEGAAKVESTAAAPNAERVVAGMTTSGRRLLDDLLSYNPQTRCTAAEAAGHSFFLEEPLPTRPERMPVIT